MKKKTKTISGLNNNRDHALYWEAYAMETSANNSYRVFQKVDIFLFFVFISFPTALCCDVQKAKQK